MDTTSLRVRCLWLDPPVLGPVVRFQYRKGAPFLELAEFLIPEIRAGLRPLFLLEGFQEQDRIDEVNPETYYRMVMVIPHAEGLTSSGLHSVLVNMNNDIRKTVEEFLNYPDERIETALHLVRYQKEVLHWEGGDTCRGAYEHSSVSNPTEQEFEVSLFGMNRMFRLLRRLQRVSGETPRLQTLDVRVLQDLQVFDRPFEFTDIRQVIKLGQHLFVEDIDGRDRILRSFRQETHGEGQGKDFIYRDTGNRLLSMDLFQRHPDHALGVTFSTDFLRRHIMQNEVDMLRTAIENIPHQMCDWIPISETDFYLLVWDHHYHKGEIHRSTLSHRGASDSLARFDVVPGSVPITFCYIPSIDLFLLGLQDDSNIYLLDWDASVDRQGGLLRVVIKSDPTAGNLVDLSILTDDAAGVCILMAVHTTCVVLYHLSVLDHE